MGSFSLVPFPPWLPSQSRRAAERDKRRSAVVTGRASRVFQMMTEKNESLQREVYFLPPFLPGFFFGAFFLAAML
jgi:hypothetical protein